MWRSDEALATHAGVMQLRSVLVQSEEQLAEMVATCSAHQSIAYDTETSGLKPSLGARIVGHCLAVRDSDTQFTGWYVPVRHQGERNAKYWQGDPEKTAREIEKILTAQGEVVMHHGKFDRLMAGWDGIRTTRTVVDTILQALVANENARSFALKKLSAAHIMKGAADEEKELTAWLHKDARQLKIPYRKVPGDPLAKTYLGTYAYARAPVDLLGQYGVRDVFYTLYLRQFVFAREVEPYQVLLEREHRMSDLLLRMEQRGLPVSRAEIERAQAKSEEEIERWRAVCVDLTGDATFENSPAYLRKLLYETLEISAPKTTKTGTLSVDKEARALIAAHDPDVTELMGAIDRLSFAEKLHSTYCASFLALVSPEGRIHGSYNQMEARGDGGAPVTGRLSASEPNLQNVAHGALHLSDCLCSKCVDGGTGPESTVSIRRYFQVPAGYVRAYCDFSQIELRVLAWFSRDPRLLECYAQDLDVHQMTADWVTDGDRSTAKQVNFGNSYGMTHKGLAKRMQGYHADPVGTEERAKVVLQQYFKVYGGILRFRRAFATQMRRNGNMFVNPFNRPRRIPTISSALSWERERAERMMMSSIISGTAADLMKESMLRTDAILQAESPESALVQTIHDELVFDLKLQPGWSSLLVKLVRAMEDWPMFADQGVPIKATCALTTTTWEAKRDIELLPDGSFRWED